jgi:hypothetical protein
VHQPEGDEQRHHQRFCILEKAFDLLWGRSGTSENRSGVWWTEGSATFTEASSTSVSESVRSVCPRNLCPRNLAAASNGAEAAELINRTFALLNSVAGKDTLRRIEDDRYVGKVGLVGLEAIAVGVAKNLDAILAHRNPQDFVRRKIQRFWTKSETATFTSLGLRGTTRIQRTVPFGEVWFRP